MHVFIAMVLMHSVDQASLQELIIVNNGVMTVLLQVVQTVFGTIMLIQNVIHVILVVTSFLKLVSVLMLEIVVLDSMQIVAINNAQLVYHLVLPVKMKQLV